MLEREIQILTLKKSEAINTSGDEDIGWFCDGQFQRILQSDYSRQLFSCEDGGKDLETILQTNLAAHFTECPTDLVQQRELELLLVSVSCLQLFVQNNWLGPRPTGFAPNKILPENVQGEELRVFLESQLSIDGEPVYGLAIYPEFLFLSNYILNFLHKRATSLKTVEWWLLRCISIHQQVLDNKSNTLRDTVIQLMDSMAKVEPLMTDDKYRPLQLEFHVEAGNLCHVYYLYREAKEHFTTAKKLAGLDVQLTGAMGKRTRYQQSEKAQLLLKVTREQPVSSSSSTDIQSISASHMPKNLNLEDDTLLDAINFSETEDGTDTPVADYEQALILGLLEDHRRSQASVDSFRQEEADAYLSFVLVQMRCWSVAVAALLLRSSLEKGSRRRVDRSMRQLEELFNETMREQPSPETRLHLFYAVKVPPVWDIQRILADILLSLGAVGSALEIFEQLEMWEEAIACYQRLGKTEKAETVIREQLQVHETANLWCFLGDITGNIDHYEKAWLLSKHRSARAQRCMGYLYFSKENYDKTLECFEKSLKVNALQVPVWFTYGCAAMAAKNFKLAAQNFKRCVALDYDNYEAWNNLASSYVKLKEKKKAFLTLNDALRCNYENWRIWENLLVVGTDCGEFNAVIRAYHKLMDLKDKWVDEEVLAVLVRAVRENIPDATGEPGANIEPKLRELFGRITARVTGKAEVWRLYAELCHKDTDKMLQFLQRSHRCVMQQSGWEKAIDQCKQVTQQSLQLAQSYCDVSEATSNATQSIQMLSSAKLMLKGVLAKIKQQHTDPVSQDIVSEEIMSSCEQLEQKLATIVDALDRLKSSS